MAGWCAGGAHGAERVRHHKKTEKADVGIGNAYVLFLS